MPEKPDRPILKLKLPKNSGAAQAEPTGPPTGKKLKLKFGGKRDGAGEPTESPATPKPKITFKSKKKPGPIAGKKRDHDGEQTPASAGPKRIKFTQKKPMSAKTPTTPFIKLKAKGKPPTRPMGIGYDSEASDAEVDPHIEEEFVLRMQPGEDCDYVRDAIANRKMGIPVREGGADVKLKFLRQDGRRAVLIVRGNIYAASMVDLPCVVEGMKSWDKKGWYKTADICQMLLVLGKVKSEEEAQNLPIPEGDVRSGTFLYEHGLTPPMKWVMKRRFRKRISTSIVMQVEQAVEDLFRRDTEAISSEYKVQTLEEANEEKMREQAEAEEQGYFDDADGEIDADVHYEGELFGQDDGEDEAEGEEWDDLFAADGDGEPDASQAETPLAHVDAQPATTDSDAATPSGVTAVIDAEDEAETPAAQDADESGSDADEDDDEDEVDEEQLAAQQARDEIADLEAAIQEKKTHLAKLTAPLLKNKQMAIIKSLEQDLALKRAAIGEEGDDD